MFIPFPAILISIASIINVADQVPSSTSDQSARATRVVSGARWQPAINWQSNGRSSRQQSAPAASD